MNRNMCLLFLVVAVVLVASAPLADAKCQWMDCHAYSSGDWCHKLGHGWKKKDMRRCKGNWGKSEKCCK